METAPLKPFATWARTALIREVRARVAAVLAPASKERVENADAVAAIERDIAAAGGGDTGRGAVADKVAYTWFNRIIALRFMDANGYTGTGVVSPQRGHVIGQPEILSDAKRGVIDTTVVTNRRAIEAITALLDGTRRSDDPQGEAYALLLTEYCRYWNRSMPFMFEREGDYTELLIPANLLADDSVLASAVAVLTEDVCLDVEVIGWLYQFYIAERKDEVFAGFKKNKRAGAAEIPAATQLFTPHWIVRYLVQNSLGRLWMLNRPSSRLVDRMEYYIHPVDAEGEFLKIGSPEQLTIVDPACGSGHMLTYAFDLLYAIYEEEGYAPADIPGLILSKNVFGVEIDARAGALAAFALTMKARARQRTFFTKAIEPNVCVLSAITFASGEIDLLPTSVGGRDAESAFWNQFERAETLGSLIRPDRQLTTQMKQTLLEQDGGGEIMLSHVLGRAERVLIQAEYLARQYSVVVANPPYMGSKNMSAGLAEWIAREYPDAKSDLFSCFFYRSTDLLLPRGQMGFMSPFVWMFITSYEKLRDRFTSVQTLTSLVQLEYSGFDGATVPICAFTAENSSRELNAGFVRLSDFLGANQQGTKAREIIQAAMDVQLARRQQFSGMERHFYRATSKNFADIPGRPIAYWLSAQTREAFKGASFLNSRVEIREGINTGDNDRFLRLWWEVSPADISLDRTKMGEESKRWVPHKKGGKFRRWSGNEEYVLDWSSSGERIHDFHNIPLSTNGAPMRGKALFFKPSLSWSRVSSGAFSIRAYPSGFSYDSTAPSIFGDQEELRRVLGLLNSSVVGALLQATSPTLDYRITALGRIPLPRNWSTLSRQTVDRLVEISQTDWDESETSWNFSRSKWVPSDNQVALVSELWNSVLLMNKAVVEEFSHLESENNRQFIEAYGLEAEAESGVDLRKASLRSNLRFRYPDESDVGVMRSLAMADAAEELVSFAVGCMFGRYSLDGPGVILAGVSSSLPDHVAEVPNPSFAPDSDNVIPIVDGDWFEDDIVARFRKFLLVSFGEQHLEENVRFVTESLGVSDLRDYFVRSFFKDHVQRYKKRPIYWLFSSPKGSFNALIYMHRYTASTVSTVLNEYLREFKSKLEASRQHHARRALSDGTPRERAAAEKEVDRLRKVLLELDEYEHEVLYPLATQQVSLDLDDGVKANYPKFGAALKKIPGLEASDG